MNKDESFEAKQLLYNSGDEVGKLEGWSLLTKYVVGAKANPPKKPRRPPKKGNVIPTNIVDAVTQIPDSPYS